jgi:hypothetical protein
MCATAAQTRDWCWVSCTPVPSHLYTGGGGVKRALSTVYLLILSSGQAWKDPPRYTAGGGLDTAGGGLDIFFFFFFFFFFFLGFRRASSTAFPWGYSSTNFGGASQGHLTAARRFVHWTMPHPKHERSTFRVPEEGRANVPVFSPL